MSGTRKRNLCKSLSGVERGALLCVDCCDFWRSNGEKATLAFGGFESKEYDQFLIRNPILNTKGVLGMTREPFALDKNGTLNAIVLQSNELLRVEFQIVEE